MNSQQVKKGLTIFPLWMIWNYTVEVRNNYDSSVQVLSIFRKDIGLEFGIEKCTMLVMKKDKIVKTPSIELSNAKFTKSWQKCEIYKYCKIWEADNFWVQEIRAK